MIDVQKTIRSSSEFTVLGNARMELTLSLVLRQRGSADRCPRSTNMLEGMDLGKPGHYRSGVAFPPAMLLAPAFTR